MNKKIVKVRIIRQNENFKQYRVHGVIRGHTVRRKDFIRVSTSTMLVAWVWL